MLCTVLRTKSLIGASALALCVSFAACGDSSSDDDGGGGGPDAGDAGSLFRCANPGGACNPHNPCAINPICGQDGLCRPQGLQNCDDGLACTLDSCQGKGKCDHIPKSDTCALSVPKAAGGGSEIKCFNAGDRRPDDPCQACDPAKGSTRWSLKEGGSCDDGNACTKNDVCSASGCKGEGFTCNDSLKCTDDVCDGKGGCKNTLQAGFCNINKTCYADQARSATGCGRCEVSVSTTAFTPLKDLCQIGSACYAPGDKDTSGCGVCDPKKNGSGWSIAPSACAIAGQCLASGAKDATGCGVCDPTRSQTAFSPLTNMCLIAGRCYSDGGASATTCGVCTPSKAGDDWSAANNATVALEDFEGATNVFTLDAIVNGVGWRVSTKRAHSGTKSLHYGDPSKGNYDNGKANKGGAVRVAVTIPSSGKSALFMWVFVDVETSDTADLLRIKAGTTTLWQKSATTLPTQAYRRWVPIEVDLSSLAGTSAVLTIEMDTVDGWANLTEGVYIDDVRVVTACSQAT